MNNSSLYTYSVEEHEGSKYLLITDRWKDGHLTVTNNIKDVVQRIKNKRRDDIFAGIIYRDMDGMWDGWDEQAEEFIILQKSSPESALKFLIQGRIIA